MPSLTIADSQMREQIDELSDDSLAEGMPTPDSTAENRAPTRVTASQTTKKSTAQSAPSRQAGSTKRIAKPAAARPGRRGKRAPLKDTTNTQDGNETEEVDDFAHSGNETHVAAMAPKRSATAKQSKKIAPAKDKKLTPPKQSSDSKTAASDAQQAEPTKPKRGRQPRPARKNADREEQPEQMELDPAPMGTAVHTEESIGKERDATIDQPPPQRRRRSASNSKTNDDSKLRIQLTEMTKKLESVELKYRSLRDLAEQGAANNFERLKQLTDERTKAAETLISSLHAELDAQSAKAREVKTLQSQLDTQTERNVKLADENAALNKSIQQHQIDMRTIQAKLNATRSGSASLAEQSSRLPGSAIKQKSHTAATSVEAAKDAQKQLLKEDLYGDLTGLLIRDVKRRDGEQEDVYDCIQTGRNGTLRFYLTVQSPAPGTKPPADYSYMEAEFQYSPVLDEANDQQLISILPDYLSDEICFPRSQAAKFYSRIQDCITKKFELVNDSDEEE